MSILRDIYFPAIQKASFISSKRNVMQSLSQSDGAHRAFPLSSHPYFLTADLDEARARISEQFRDHKLDRAASHIGGIVRQNSVRLHETSLHYLDYGGSARIKADALGAFYLLVLPITGRASLRFRGVETVCDTDQSLLVPCDAAFEFRWDPDCRALILRLERSAVERKFDVYCGLGSKKTIQFDCALPTHSGAGRFLKELVGSVVREVDLASPLHAGRLFIRELEQTITGCLLSSHGHNYSHLLDTRHGLPATRAVSVASQYVEENADGGLTLDDLCAAAGITQRALQSAFQRHYGMTPTQYVRKIRLDRARDDLVASSKQAGGTVTDIALKWGFGHVGRFSMYYARAFGEPPSVTLCRLRR